MNPRRIGAVVLTMLLNLTFVSSAQKPTAEAVFREGLRKERAEGKLREAIFRYERVLEEFPGDREVVARALYQLSLAYEKLQDPRAKLMLTRLSGAAVEPYSTRARAKLATLQAAASPALFKEREVSKEYESGSPDGKFVVYHKGENWGQLYLKDLQTDQERLLLNHIGTVSNFAWSPDSRQLAYNFQNAEQKVNEIRTVQILTGESASLGLRGYPRGWTHLGEIFFYRPNYPKGTVDFSLVPATGGTPRQVYAEPSGTGCCTAINPDGRSLLLTRSRKLFLLDLASGTERALTDGTGEETRPVFSPDGRLAAFLANQDGNWAFYAAPLDRGLPVRSPLKIAAAVQPGLGRGRSQWWTSDGLLTFSMELAESNIYRIEMEPGTGRAADSPQRLTQDAAENLLPSISPDGKQIAYWYQNNTKVGIAVMDSRGVNERPLFQQSHVLNLSWSGPEDILFYNFVPPEGEKPSIHSLNVKTGALRPVAKVEGLYWKYVPSRKEILHLYPGGGGARPSGVLKAFSLNESKDRTVATIDYLTHLVSPSPDGKRIAYVVARGGDQGTCEVCVMSVNGEQQTSLVPAQKPCVIVVDWSSDGKFLLLSSERGPSVMNVETRQTWPLHSETGDASWGLSRGGAWSPDGSYIAITKSTRRTERLAWEGVTAEAVARLWKK